MAILYVFLWDRIKARVQNGTVTWMLLSSNKLVAHEESEIWINLPHSLTKEGLLTAAKLVEFV